MSYVGRDGQPIEQEEAMAAFADDASRRIGADHVNGHYVSTVWLVIDHGFGGKFWWSRQGMHVSCYREDETPERVAAIAKANKRLDWFNA